MTIAFRSPAPSLGPSYWLLVPWSAAPACGLNELDVRPRGRLRRPSASRAGDVAAVLALERRLVAHDLLGDPRAQRPVVAHDRLRQPVPDARGGHVLGRAAGPAQALEEIGVLVPDDEFGIEE